MTTQGALKRLLKFVGVAAAAMIILILFSACQPATPEPTPTEPQLQAEPLQVSTSASLVNLENSGDWSAEVTLDASGGQPPYTYETEWPRAGEATYNVRASDCEPVRFTALVTSADGQQYPVNVQFGPTACRDIAAAAPTVQVQPPDSVADATASASPVAGATAPAPTTGAATPAQSDAATELLNRINALRAENGLAPYTLNDRLSAAAVRHSQDMANTGNISHTGSDGSTVRDRILAAGYPATASAENIYAGTTLDDAWDFWSTDPDHRPSLLSAEYTEIGFAQVKGSTLTYFTLTFGAR